MVIKYWAKKYGITGSTQCFTTYSLIMLVIFYLQQVNPPLLPPIATLQRLADRKEFSCGWMSSFCDEEWTVRLTCLKEENNLTLKELLAGFFQYYRDFDYQNVICPSVGRPVPTEHFKSADDIPEEMQLYKEKLQKEPDNKKLKFRTDVMIRAQDPLELNWNITKNVVDKTFFLFIAACEESWKLMAETDERSLLGTLFSIDKDSLNLSVQPYVKVSIGLASVAPSSGIDIDEQYKLTLEAVLLVMRQVMKAEMELYEPKVLSKVQKVNPSQDVHTMSNVQAEDEGLVYVCHGNSNVIALRKKMRTNLENLDLSLSEYEQEICISNALQCLNTNQNFSFDLKISSLNRSKNSNCLDITLSGIEEKKGKKSKKPHTSSFSKEVANFILHNLKKLVKCAVHFIIDTKSSSPALDVKKSLRELFDLKMAKLPNLNDILRANSLDKESPSTSGCGTNIEQQQCLLLQSIEKDNNETGNSSTSHYLGSKHWQGETTTHDTMKSKPSSLERSLEEVVCLVDKETITSDITKLKHISVENNLKGQAMENVHLLKTVTLSAKTEAVIDEFLNPHKPDRLVTIESVKDDTIDQFSDMLNTVMSCETQSSLTIEKNPFLASIEKVKLNELTLDLNKSESSTKQTKTDGNCKYVKTESKEDLSDLDKQYKAHLRNVNNKNNENNKRKMDLNYDNV